VLAGVLLHQVEAALPVDPALHLLCGEGSSEEVDYSTIGLALDRFDNNHVGAAVIVQWFQHTSVVGLAAAGGVECGLIQDDRRAAFPL